MIIPCSADRTGERYVPDIIRLTNTVSNIIPESKLKEKAVKKKPKKKLKKKPKKNGRPLKSVTLECDGKIIHYKSRAEMAQDMGLKTNYIPLFLERLNSSKKGFCKSKGKTYKLIDG